MAANKIIRIGPIALSTTLTTNILNPGTTTGGVNAGTAITNLYYLIRHLTVVNKTGSPVTVSLWVGATGGNAAGTEVIWQAQTIPANSFIEKVFYPGLRLDIADFLVGGCNTATAATLQGEAEIGIA